MSPQDAGAYAYGLRREVLCQPLTAGPLGDVGFVGDRLSVV
jgi:hypothetical protein